jgi:hypothetical protein
MTDPKQSAEELFGEALELPPEGRAAFVERMCGHVYELVTPTGLSSGRSPIPSELPATRSLFWQTHQAAIAAACLCSARWTRADFSFHPMAALPKN